MKRHTFKYILLSKRWCWSWNSNTLATWCEELTPWKRPWCWGRLKAGGEGDDRGWNGWMASSTQWTWVWASSGRWWRTGKPGVLQSMGSQRVTYDWATELNWSKRSQWKDHMLYESKCVLIWKGQNNENNERISGCPGQKNGGGKNRLSTEEF